MLRPGAAVEAVEEGLLFSGWQGSTLMVCRPGVAKVWRAVEPAVRGGFEAAALRERLPEAARGVCDVLVATLRDNGMLMPAPVRWAAGERAQEYLAHSAAEPDVAAERLAATAVGVRGAAGQVAEVARLLGECGIRLAQDLDDDAEVGWSVYVGDRSGFTGDELAAVVAAVAVGKTIVVAPCETGADRLRAALDRLPAEGEPAPLTWAVARTVLIECVHRLLAGTSRPDRCFLVDATGSLDVPLAPPRRRPSPTALAAGPWRPRDDTALLARLEPVTADRVGPFPAPAPGTLVQHPLARQTAGGAQGAGLDQARAGADAVLAHLRDQAAGFGGHPVVGDGPADLLADTVGRLAVAEASEPGEPWTPGTPVSRRWVQAVTRLSDGRTPAVATTRSRGAVVARAVVAGRESWGYGADAETAAEHAVRGLLKAVVADLPTGPHAVVVAHEAATALPLLAAALGIPEDRTPPVEPLLATLGVQLLDLGGGLAGTGILVGTVGGRP